MIASRIAAPTGPAALLLLTRAAHLTMRSTRGRRAASKRANAACGSGASRRRLGQHDGVLDRQRGALARGGRRRVGGVADHDHPPAVPRRQPRHGRGSGSSASAPSWPARARRRARRRRRRAPAAAAAIRRRRSRASSPAAGSSRLRHVGEPPDLPVGRQRVAEERAPAEDHLVAARLRVDPDAAREAAGGEQARSRPARARRVDDPPHRRADAVAADRARRRSPRCRRRTPPGRRRPSRAPRRGACRARSGCRGRAPRSRSAR